jgi:hypothetical protein
MPNIGRNSNKEPVFEDMNESTEEFVPMLRQPVDPAAPHEPDQEMGVLAGGKKLMLAKHPNNAGYYFKFSTGGVIPKSLEGVWLTYHVAKSQAEIYLSDYADANAIEGAVTNATASIK